MDCPRLLLILQSISLLCHMCLTEQCVKVSNCECRTSSGSINLSPLSNPNPRYKASSQDYNYKYSPCVGLSGGCGQGVAGPVAVCQESKTGTSQYCAGDQASAEFSGDPATDSVVVQYSYTDSLQTKRTSRIALHCDHSEVNGRFTFVDEKPTGTYVFTLHVKNFCTTPDVEPSHGISTGSVLLILFFVLLFVYFVGGVIFLKFVKGAQGIEMVPNLEFWKSLPGLIRDGVLFVSRGCKADSSYSEI